MRPTRFGGWIEPISRGVKALITVLDRHQVKSATASTWWSLLRFGLVEWLSGSCFGSAWLLPTTQLAFVAVVEGNCGTAAWLPPRRLAVAGHIPLDKIGPSAQFPAHQAQITTPGQFFYKPIFNGIIPNEPSILSKLKTLQSANMDQSKQSNTFHWTKPQQNRPSPNDESVIKYESSQFCYENEYKHLGYHDSAANLNKCGATRAEEAKECAGYKKTKTNGRFCQHYREDIDGACDDANVNVQNGQDDED